MTSGRKPSKNKNIIKIIVTAVAAGILLFAGVHIALTNQAIRDAREFTGQTLEFLDNRVTEYKNNVTNDKIKSLIRLLDKTVELVEILDYDRTYTADRLKRYAHEQRLSGIAVFDENLEIVMKTQGSYEKEFFIGALGTEELAKIVRFKEASYMHRTGEGDDSVDMAVVSRRDRPGAVVCYKTYNSITAGVNDITLDTMFQGMVFKRDGIIAVSDGDTILASNKDLIIGKSVKEAKSLYSGSFKQRDNGLIKLTDSKGSHWYGNQQKLGEYTLSAFFPASQIFMTRFAVMAVTVTVYIVLWLIFITLMTLAGRRNLRKAAKNIRTIESIGRIYMAIIETSLADGSITVLKPSGKGGRLREDFRNIEDIGAAVYESIPEEDIRETVKEFWDYTTLEKRLEDKDILDISFRNNDGEWILLEIIPQHRNRYDQVETVLYLLRDISEDKKKEIEYQNRLRSAVDEAQRASIAKTDFLRRMSHDIKTPINGIRGMLEIAEHYPDDPEKQKECRSKVRQTSGFLLALVNSVLDMNKLESGKIKLDEKPFNLAEFMDGIETVAEIQAKESGVEYISRGIRAEHMNLIGSPLHLRQILQNLITNAIKYNRAGGYVAVSCIETDTDGENTEVEFVCEDNGIGMSESFQERAFEAFEQENTDARTMYTGTGLGLAISKELTEAMGGTINLESKPGVGTRFTVKLRFRINTETEHREHENSPGSIEGVRILLAEDNDINMEIAEFILTSKGAEVTTACNGLEAIDKFEASEPGYFDLVLMDIMMPVMDGLEAAGRIRAMKRSDAADVPIFAMTANAFSDDAQRSRQAGMNEHLTKPLDSEALVKMILKYTHKG